MPKANTKCNVNLKLCLQCFGGELYLYTLVA